MQIWNADSEGLLDMYADDTLTVEYTHTEKINGIESYKKYLQFTYRTFPDIKIYISEIMPNKKENTATVFWYYKGTHQNNRLFGVEPVAKPVVVNAMTLLKFSDKKVIAEKGIIDNLSLLMQLNPQP